MAVAVNEKLAPTNPLGVVLQGTLSPIGMAPWTQFVDDMEHVPELRWPESISIYNQMRTDSQLSALFRGTTLPIQHFDWHLDDNGASENILRQIADDLRLPIAGEEKVRPMGRAKDRFDFNSHMRLALRGMLFGHAYFEQVGYIGDDQLWHLKKLSERPQKTIQEIMVAEDGGLVYIKQNITKQRTGFGNLPTIPVDRLVGYIWEQEDGSWVGRSALRDCYKNWLCKDRLIRIDVLNHERAGGVPYVVGQPGATPQELEHLHEMAREFKIGEASGGAIPFGAQMQIARASNTDVINSIRYHDEAMARQWLLMVMQLGQTTTGSRALGRTFHDFFAQGLDTIATWFRDVFNMHVIEDYVDWNWGPGEKYVPRLDFNLDVELAVEEIARLIDVNAIVVDRDLEVALRKELGLPLKMSGAPDPVPSSQLATELAQMRTPTSPSSEGQGDGAPADEQHPPKPAGTTKQGGGTQ